LLELININHYSDIDFTSSL